MSKEKKIVELKDEELEKVSGGWQRSRPANDENITKPSCYHTLVGLPNGSYSIKASCEGCDYFNDCGNKYIK